MKKFLALFLSVAMWVVLIPGVGASTYFSDVPASHEFAKYIDHLAEENIVSGSGGKYYMDNNVSRGEIVKMTVLAAGISLDSSGDQLFSDVPPSNGFYSYIQTAAKNNIVSGYGDGTFGVDDKVTRGASTKIIVNAFGYEKDLSGAPHFDDVPASHTFYDFVETAYNKDLISGYGNRMFGVDDSITRGQMAKILSLALGGPAMDDTEQVEGDVILKYGFNGFPTGTAEIFDTSPNKLSFEFNNLDPLSSDYIYEAWLYADGEYESMGRFDMDEDGDLANKAGARITNEFEAETDIEDATKLMITIETEDEEGDMPSDTVIMDTNIDDDSMLYLDFPVNFPGYDGTVSVDGKDVTLTFNDLPNLNGLGFNYEGWFLDNGNYVSTGKFQGKGTGLTMDTFTYVDEPDDIEKVIVSVEPMPDTDSDPFQIMPFMTGNNPFSGGDADDEEDEEEEENENIPTDGDYDVYDGLTSEQTDLSIVSRTQLIVDEDEDIIVEAYPAAKTVPDGSSNTIVIKVSDLDGDPISELDLVATQLSGTSGNLTDPEELDDTGVYLVNYDVDTGSDLATSTDEVIISISQEDKDEDEPDFPEIEVEFNQTKSSVVGAPKKMEIDIPFDMTVYDDNLNSSEQQDTMVVLTIVTDSRGYPVLDLRNDLELISVGGGDIDATPDEEGGIYPFEIDIDNIIDDDANVTVTYSAEGQVQLLTSSGGLFIPIISDEFELNVEFIPQED